MTETSGQLPVARSETCGPHRAKERAQTRFEGSNVILRLSRDATQGTHKYEIETALGFITVTSRCPVGEV